MDSGIFHILSFDLPQYLELSINALPIRRDSTGENTLVWSSASNGEFDSQNAYLLALNSGEVASNFLGHWIWKLNILPKIQFLLWKCAHFSLPVKVVLLHRKILEDPVCDICKEGDETILHVFRDCRKAYQF